jgi:hypothetical protein
MGLSLAAGACCLPLVASVWRPRSTHSQSIKILHVAPPCCTTWFPTHAHAFTHTPILPFHSSLFCTSPALHFTHPTLVRRSWASCPGRRPRSRPRCPSHSGSNPPSKLHHHAATTTWFSTHAHALTHTPPTPTHPPVPLFTLLHCTFPTLNSSHTLLRRSWASYPRRRPRSRPRCPSAPRRSAASTSW